MLSPYKLYQHRAGIHGRFSSHNNFTGSITMSWNSRSLSFFVVTLQAPQARARFHCLNPIHHLPHTICIIKFAAPPTRALIHYHFAFQVTNVTRCSSFCLLLWKNLLILNILPKVASEFLFYFSCLSWFDFPQCTMYIYSLLLEQFSGLQSAF